MVNKEFEDWEDSLEGIWDSIKTFHSDTLDDEEGQRLIVKTLYKLPKDVRMKVLKKVIFVYSYCAGVSRSLFFRKSALELKKKSISTNSKEYEYLEFEQPIIVLNFQEMIKDKEMDTIAHEIAHFILGHYKMGKISDGKNEREADDLNEKWGFKRSYTEEEYKKLEKHKEIK